MNNIYINKSKALSSSLVERVGASTTLNSFVPLKDVAQAKGLQSTRSLRLELNKHKSKYISREVQVNGDTSYEILFSSLEPELQDKLRRNEKKTTALVSLNYQPPQFLSDQAKITANFRLNIIIALIKFRNKYSTKKTSRFRLFRFIQFRIISSKSIQIYRLNISWNFASLVAKI